MGAERRRQGLRRRFDRAAPRYEAAAALDAEIARRMLERLDLMRVEPRRVLDVGAGTGRDQRALRARYPRALVVAADHSPGMLREARRAGGVLARLLGRVAPVVAADAGQLPFAGATFDFLWSNLLLPWVEDPLPVVLEWSRVVRPEGLLMFSAFGPDTLRELAAAGAEAGGRRMRAFADMHDLGDALVEAGFANPVMDAERLSLSYTDARACLADLRAVALTAGGEKQGVSQVGLGAKARLRALEAALEGQRRDGRLTMSFEIVYGHAWRGLPTRTREGHAIVRADFGIPRANRQDSARN